MGGFERLNKVGSAMQQKNAQMAATAAERETQRRELIITRATKQVILDLSPEIERVVKEAINSNGEAREIVVNISESVAVGWWWDPQTRWWVCMGKAHTPNQRAYEWNNQIFALLRRAEEEVGKDLTAFEITLKYDWTVTLLNKTKHRVIIKAKLR